MKNIFTRLYFFIKYIIPVILMAGIIFYLSSRSGLGDMKNNTVEVFFRKGAHFMEYGLLSFLLWRLFYRGWRFFLIPAFWFSLVLVTLYAISDEGHQFFVEGRSGKIVDVAVDFLSAFVMLQAITFFVSRKRKYLGWLIAGLFTFSIVVGFLTWETKSQKLKVESQKFISLNDSRRKVESLKSTNFDKGVATKKTKGKENGELSLSQKKESSVERVEVVEKVVLPNKILYEVPFTTQSPFAKWDQLHEEACEEASLIMLKYYNDKSKGKKPGVLPNVNLSKEVAEDEIQKLVKYQMEKYGDFYDTDVKINKEIGEEYFELENLKIIKDFEIVDLKRELADGNIILIPTAGRELHNPNFKAPGPLYHNLVIIGYDDNAIIDSAGRSTKGIFITNDPGTRKGKNYKYDQQVLYDAIHDFPGDVNKILTGKKRALVLTR